MREVGVTVGANGTAERRAAAAWEQCGVWQGLDSDGKMRGDSTADTAAPAGKCATLSPKEELLDL